MSILQMSFSASILILVIIVIRALAINRLPKKTFLAFWAVALLRLLIPFSFPSPFSVYSVVSNHPTVTDTMTGTPAANLFPITAPVQMQPENIAPAPISTPAAMLSWWTVIWIAGIALCSIYFVIAYVKCYKEFRTSTAIQNAFVDIWLAEHKIMRPISIRQSTRISAPLTYGIFHPVILLPPNMDWSNEKQVQYILAHEYTHIRRFDTVTKLFLTAALCIHWFNPLVWAMYILSNRDIELSCDETVVRSFGETIKTAYALALVGMEERRSVFSPYYNSFSKNAIEERIVAIMKIKKTSLIAIGIAITLLVCVTTVFATSARGSAADNPPAQNTTTQLPKELEEKYDLLLDFRFDGYRDMTISEYQNAVNAKFAENEQAYFDMLNSVDEGLLAKRYTDSDAFFIANTLIPLTAERWNKWEFRSYVPSSGADIPPVEYAISRSILDENKLTVGQHEDMLTDILNSMQTLVTDNTGADGVNASGIRAGAQALATKHTNDALTVKLDVGIPQESAPSGGTGANSDSSERIDPASQADYQLLLDTFKINGYAEMSVNDYTALVQSAFNGENSPLPAAYERVLGDFIRGETPSTLSSEDAYFLSMTLGRTVDEYIANHQSNYAADSRPVIQQFHFSEITVQYNIEYEVLDGDRLTVSQRDTKVTAVLDELANYIETQNLSSSDKAALQDKVNTVCQQHTDSLLRFSGEVSHFIQH